jgi:hypothetical protein
LRESRGKRTRTVERARREREAANTPHRFTLYADTPHANVRQRRASHPHDELKLKTRLFGKFFRRARCSGVLCTSFIKLRFILNEGRRLMVNAWSPATAESCEPGIKCAYVVSLFRQVP